MGRALAVSVAAGLVLGGGLAGLDSAPVAAAPAPEESSTSTTTSTTSPAVAPATQPTVPVVEGGEPDPGGERSLPADSLDAASADLDRLDAALAGLADRRVSALARTEQASAELRTSRQTLAEARERRIDRIVRAYEMTASDAAFDQLVEPGVMAERIRGLTRAADRADRREISDLEALIEERRDELDRLDRLVTTLDDSSREIRDTRDGIVAKLAAATASVGSVGALTPAGAGPSDIARAARAADEAYVAVGLASDPTAVAERVARYDVARAELIAALTRTTSVVGDDLEATWAVTAAPALRAMYFALSQVGKDYVYATAGPSRYDCSGLTKRAWAQNGIALPHFSGAQLSSGIRVEPVDLRPGDLLTYGPGGSEHVVMYIGAGYTVEAKGRAYGVVVESSDTNPGSFAGASRPMP